MAAEGRRVGIGLACYVEGTGVGPYEGAHVHIETSGKVKVATGLTTQGQGHATVFAQLVADELGVKFEDVEVVTGDTRRMPYAVGTFASRAAVMSGSAIHLAAKRAKEKVLRIAAEALEADESDLEIVDGVVAVKGSPGSSIDLGTVAVLSNPLRYAFDEASQAATQFSVGDPGKPPVAEDDEPGLEGRDFYSPERATFASGMHAVIVETDPETAEITILKYAVVHDCGNLINPMIVEGQIHGGVAQGVGGALYERMAYDESGQLQNASFMDFLMPYVTEIPDGIDIDHLETPSPLNPLGIKGAGEAGVIPSAAVFAAAIEDAERHHPIIARCRSRRPSCSTSERRTDEDQRHQLDPVPRRPGVGRAARPRGAGAHHPRLRAAGDDTGDNTYAMTVTAGVAAIKGTYDGTCALSDLVEHQSLVMRLQGAGAPGTIDATVQVAFERRRRRDPDLLRGRRGRRRHGRRRRPADAQQRLEADGQGVLRQRRRRVRSGPAPVEAAAAAPERAPAVYERPAAPAHRRGEQRLPQGHRRRRRPGAARRGRRALGASPMMSP